jgi:predicted MFS family arabinose efflux permease
VEITVDEHGPRSMKEHGFSGSATAPMRTSAGSPASTAEFSVVRIFFAFAAGYFLSALLRAVTATLAPSFSTELGLKAGDLGLLAGAYFLGFAALQLPLGSALDRFGPKRVLLGLMALAVLGCGAFALAQTLWGLTLARVLIGMGLAACLMAPLTCFRLRFSAAAQLRANSWMLMTGSLGMVASTLPVQWLLPLWGWRGLFWALAGGLVLAMLLIARWAPADPAPASALGGEAGGPSQGYRQVLLHPVFVRSVPIGFFLYGGMVAVQSLWAGPWLTQVAGWSAAQAAGGLFVINLCMLLAFMGWGALMPRLVQRGYGAQRLMTWGLPLNLLVLAWIVFDPQPAGAATWALWCVACTFVSLSQPAVGQSFAPQWAGRALSAYNLVIFAGVFCMQWGIGLMVDAARGWGWSAGAAFRLAFGLFGLCCLLSVVFFVRPPQRWRVPLAASAQ